MDSLAKLGGGGPGVGVAAVGVGMGAGTTPSVAGAASSSAVVLAAREQQWVRFFAHAIASRLDPDTFAQYVPLLAAKHPLPPTVVADLVLRPTPGNSDTLDPRVPKYLQSLFELRIVDVPSVLRGLYRYSTSHAQAGSQGHEADRKAKEDREHPNGEKKQVGDGGREGAKVPKWSSSYSAEEVIFYRLTKAVAQGAAIKTTRDATEVAAVMARWMNLFTAAAAAFAEDVMGQLHSPQNREEMESARAAFVLLLLRVCENPVMLAALGEPFAKAPRAMLSESLANFVPSILQSASQIATRLELFRTQTLAGFEPVDKKKEAANAEIDDLLDSTMGLENFVIPELPITNSRAGLYVYLNASVGGLR